MVKMRVKFQQFDFDVPQFLFTFLTCKPLLATQKSIFQFQIFVRFEFSLGKRAHGQQRRSNSRSQSKGVSARNSQKNSNQENKNSQHNEHFHQSGNNNIKSNTGFYKYHYKSG